ncbi:MAG: amidohydrolase family protein [bacterium]|nr:amidohydrolase family protein [bacterium]
MDLKIKTADRRMWREIRDIIPENIFDFHVHSFREDGFLEKIPESLKIYLPCDTKTVLTNLKKTFPGRKIKAILTGWPSIDSDIEKQNEYIALQAEKRNLYFLALVSPHTDLATIEKLLKKKECIGLKPYKCFAKNSEDARITDFIPMGQLEFANHYGLIITLHLSRRAGVVDPVNLRDIINLAEKFPSIKWNLAHCGRSFVIYYIEKHKDCLKELNKENIYFDTAAISDSEVFTYFFSIFGSNKILFGSDSPISFLHGKSVGFGYDWAFIAEETHKITASFPVSPCLLLYEQLMAMHRAFKKVGFTRGDIELIFSINANRIVRDVISRKLKV